MCKKILITGAAGFIGFNFIKECLKKNIKVFAVDALKYSANTNEIKKLSKNRNFFFYKLNINNKKKIFSILKKNKILNIVNFAAETHVDNSIQNPKYFFENNCIFFLDFLSAVKKFYDLLHFDVKKKFRFIHISTDEIYGSLGVSGKAFVETSPIKPNNPYSASKASSELILRGFSKTFFLPYIITNCSNNYGNYQNDEKFIPTVFRSALKNKKIPIYGNGKNIRDWIYVVDHCKAILKIISKGKNFEKYNIGANSEISNFHLAILICKILDKKRPLSNKNSYKNLISHVPDRLGHDFRYSVNSRKLKKIGWNSSLSLSKGLLKIADYYIERYSQS
tara:strand:- start:2560 stop:3567 length:1008 start_codon:yes stop_codon:yes gene_type:complete